MSLSPQRIGWGGVGLAELFSVALHGLPVLLILGLLHRPGGEVRIAINRRPSATDPVPA